MQRSTRFSRSTRERYGRWTLRHLAALGALGALTLGCAEPTGPGATPTPNSIIIIGGKLLGVLNTQFRGIGDPDIMPVSSVRGHLQLKVYDTGDGGYAAAWKGKFFNPECESLLGGGIYAVQDSEDFPNPETRPTVRILPDDQPIGCGKTDLEGSTGISADLAARLIGNPDIFIAVFFTQGGGLIVGTFSIGNPNDVPSR